MIKIFSYKHKLDTIFDEHKICSILSDDEIARGYKLKFVKDRQIFLASRLLLRYYLAGYLKISPKEIKFGYTKYGRPRLLGPRIKNFDFNLSHSGDWTIFAISLNGRVGIDVEEIRKIDASLVDQSFANLEIEYIAKSRKKIQDFYKIWTLKEAFIKAVGQGLSRPLKKFAFNFAAGHISLLPSGLNEKWQGRSFRLDGRHQAAVCWPKGEAQISFSRIGDLKKII